MAKREHDEMAAALDAMMGGASANDEHEVVEEDSSAPEVSQPAQTAPPSPVRPASPQTAVSAGSTPPPAARRSLRPATPEAAIASKARSIPAPAGHQSIFMSLGFRQTVIPPLLTGGLLLLIFSALPYVMAADSAFAAIPQWVTLVCAIVGIVLIATGVLNMLLVKRQLEESALPR